MFEYWGQMVWFHRKKSGLSREALAVLAGVGKTVVYDIEKGKASVKLETWLKVLDVLNIQLHFQSPLMHLFETQHPRPTTPNDEDTP